MKEQIIALKGKFLQIRWKEDEYENRCDGYIIKTTPTSFTFEYEEPVPVFYKEGSYKHKHIIKYKDVTKIKKREKPICPVCKSVQINDYRRDIFDGPNKLGTAINCCICIDCGILFINKNDRDQCLWNS